MKTVMKTVALMLLAASVGVCFFSCEKDKNKDKNDSNWSITDDPIFTPWEDV